MEFSSIKEQHGKNTGNRGLINRLVGENGTELMQVRLLPCEDGFVWGELSLPVYSVTLVKLLI